MEARMGHTWEPYMGAIHGSKNGPHVRAIMGHTWEPYMEVLRLSVQHLGVTSIGPRLVLVERSVKDLRIVGFVQVLDMAR